MILFTQRLKHKIPYLPRYYSSSTQDKENLGQNLKRDYLNFEKKFTQNLDLEYLSPRELTIHNAHALAISKGHYTYDDPETGLRVMSRMIHFYRARCCGNACRHCIYNFENAPDELKMGKRFNTLFWTD
uniref:Protein C1orf53 n=1 Tax=Lepeophtheirus salmonis TaxID=72036 RepID=D3PII9_LEPSM|nr:protein C1orf53 [Lepeophtheirus salmonis]